MNAPAPTPDAAFRPAATSGRRSGVHRLRPLAAALGQALAALGAGAWLAPAQALPTGAINVAGQVNAAPVDAGRLVLTQTTPRAVVDWQGFSIAAGESVRLQQPDKGIALFNVIGRESSQIFGTLTATGTLFLTNPNGVLFGAGSNVEVGAMVASTLRLSADDFKLGRYRFAGDSTASVVNRGSIKAAAGGYAVLLGQSVDNSGLVSAPQGTVALGAASAATLDVYGNGLLTLQLNTATDAATVNHTGTLRAPGGRIEVSALGTAARPAAINVGGLLQAQRLQERNGEIILTASGPGASLSFAAGAIANADGGGRVRLLSDGATTFAGNISAREGGSAEVSGVESVTLTGSADLRSADGRFGTLVIDPANIVIRAGGVGDSTANTLTDGFLSALLTVANVTVLTSAAPQTAAPSINVLGDTRIVWSVASNLTLDASRDLAVQAGARLSNTNAGATAFDALVLRANASGTAAGTSAGVSLGAGTQLLASRGSIGVQGTGGTVGAGNVGVVLGAGTKLRSGDGNITISGTGGGNGSGSNNAGVQVADQSSLIASGTGAVTMTGVGGKSTADAPGVQFGPGVGTLATNSGALTVIGTGGSAASGQAQGIVSTADAELRSTSGNISLRGAAASTAIDGIAFLSGANRIGGGSGNISFTSDRISLLAGSTAQTTGTVLLQPLSSERPVNIGAGDTNVSLGLAGAELNRITAGRIQVGNPKTGEINLSQSFSPTGTDTLSLVSALAVTESPQAAFTVPKLSIEAGSVNLPNANQVGTLAATATRGNVVFNEADALTVGTVAGHQGMAVNGVRASGSVLITAPNGRLTLEQPLSAGAAGDALTTASKSFTNNAGGAALTAANGRWRVFSSDPADDVRSTQAFDFKRYDCNFGGACTPGIPGAGNGFLYSIAPVLSLKLARNGGVYGDAPVIGSSNYELAGLIDGDTLASVGLTGTALFTTGASATANVGDYPVTYAGGLSTVIGYRITQTVTPSSIYTVRARPITVAADGQSRVYGNANPALTYTVGGLGLVNGDTLTGALATTAGATSNVGSYAITQGTLAASPNYALSFTGANLTIAARAVSVAADAQSRIYGNANPALTYTVGGLGLVNGDTLSGALATTASATSNVGSYAITQGTLAASPNYALSFTGANLTIAARALSVAADAQSRIYGNANPSLTYTVGGLGLVNGDTLSGALTTTASATSNVGSYAITQGTLAASPNYALSFTGASLTIAARALSVAADAQSRIYGNANPALTYTVGGLGLVNGDTLTGALATTASATNNVGSYAITQGTLAASPNYALSFTGANLIIAARALSVAADAQSRIYGNANPSLTYTVGGLGLVNGDTLSGALTTTASATSNVGSYAITQGTLAASPNYALSFTGANLTIAARALSVAADAQSRIYGNANPSLTYTVGGLGLVNGDTLSGALTTTASATSNVGSYAITQGTLAASPNYALSFTGANLTIAARALSVAADAQSRIYGNANPALTYTVGGLGLVNGDTLTGALATTAGATSNVGSYAITRGTLAASPNYALSFTGANLTIAARALSVAADAQSRVYGNANPALTYTVGGLGLVNGDTLTGALATTAGATSNVGSYAITQGTLAASPNYALSFTGANLTIAARALSVAADAQSRIYGNANPALTYTVGGLGLVNGDALSGALATTASVTSNVGSYAITQGTLAASPNYALSFTGANLTIAARALSVAADAQSRIYGNANPSLTYTVGGLGLVNGDTLSGALTTTASATSNVGSYAITQGTLAASPNYALSFTGANLTIAARALSVAADAQSRIYGNANPSLTYTVGGLGLVNGDALSGALTTTASVTSNVGSYAITQGTLAASANYALSFTGANLTIAARALSVAADAQSRIYGNANPALTYTVGGLGLVNGDTLTGALTTTASATSNVGSYTISQGTLAASPNYALSFTGANLTIAARALSVAADAQSRIYGNANPALTYAVGGLGLVNGDTLTGALATTASAISNVGSYAITQGTLAASANYALSFTGANLAIAARALSVAADAQSRIYGNANPALTYAVGGLGLVNGDTLTGVLATTASATSNVGGYAITQGTLAASPNYALSFTGADLTIAARALSVAADAQSRIYGNANPALTYAVGGLGLVNGDTLTGALATTASATSNVGSYSITQGTLAATPNYTVSYTGANVAVAQRAITLTPTPQTRVYGNANPGAGSAVVTLGNLVNGDSVSSVGLSAPAALATTAAGSTAPLLASSAVFGSGLASNYSIAYAPGSLAIGQRGISVAAVPGQGKTVGAADPALAYNVVGGSLVNGDGFTGSLVRTSGEAPGRYAIGLGTLSAGTNYALSYTGADFLVGVIPGIGPIDRNPGQGTPVSNPLATFLASLDTLAPTAAGPDAAGTCIVEQPLGTTGDLVQRSTAAPAADNRLVNAGIRLPQGVIDPCRTLPERERKAPFISVSGL